MMQINHVQYGNALITCTHAGLFSRIHNIKGFSLLRVVFWAVCFWGVNIQRGNLEAQLVSVSV